MPYNKNLKKGYMIPFVFIIVIALAAIVYCVTHLSTLGIKNIGLKIEQQKALFIAEAGINKAIWYLTAPPAEGGKGIAWRSTGLTEEFAGGNYTIIVEDDPVGMKITVISTYCNEQRTLQLLASEDFSKLYTRYALSADSDLNIELGAKVKKGKVAVTDGHQITGEGEYVIGSNMAPVLTTDTTYYNNQIAYAESGGPEVVGHSATYTDLDLNGLPLYVEGSVTLNGNIIGAAEIISTRDINVKNGASIGEKIKLIAKNYLDIEDLTTIKKDVVLYGGEAILISPNTKLTDAVTIISPKELNVGDYSEISGVVNVGKLALGRDVIVEGSISIGNLVGAHVFNTSTFIDEKHDQAPPPGFEKTVKIRKWLKR
ncbi:MAG: hypothetical protein V3T21_05665 [Candidatus Margulisiibacteriota bacterium]